MKPTRVCFLEGGSMAIDGYKIYWNRGPGGLVRFPVYSLVIDHAKGLFLFDTGFDLGHAQTHFMDDEPIQAAEQSVTAQLAKLGYGPEDVSYVVNSHLHFDHTGGNKDFPNATFICHENEYQAAANPQPFERMSYSDIGFARQLAGDRQNLPPTVRSGPSPSFELLRGDIEVVSGVWLFETPGHSAGHYSLLVQLANRAPMLLTGDAAMTPRSLDEMIIGGFHLDPAGATRSLERLKSLAAEHSAEMFCSHHMESYESWLKSPEWYE